jgi:hypothetical protein
MTDTDAANRRDPTSPMHGPRGEELKGYVGQAAIAPGLLILHNLRAIRHALLCAGSGEAHCHRFRTDLYCAG